MSKFPSSVYAFQIDRETSATPKPFLSATSSERTRKRLDRCHRSGMSCSSGPGKQMKLDSITSLRVNYLGEWAFYFEGLTRQDSLEDSFQDQVRLHSFRKIAQVDCCLHHRNIKII